MPEAKQDIQDKVEYGSDSLQDSALPTPSKIKRTRKAWVYQSEYDDLKRRYHNSISAGVVGYLLALLLSLALYTVMTP
jgi:ABC-type nitrate/sulfonate/bicarbonate transport system permease component